MGADGFRKSGVFGLTPKISVGLWSMRRDRTLGPPERYAPSVFSQRNLARDRSSRRRGSDQVQVQSNVLELVYFPFHVTSAFL